MKEVGGVFHISTFYLTLRAILHLVSSASSVATELLRIKLLFCFKKMLLKEKQGHAGWDWAWFGGWEKVESDPSAATLTPELQ